MLLERELWLLKRFVLSFDRVEECLLDILRTCVVEIFVNAIHAVECERCSLAVVTHRGDLVAENIEYEKESLSAPALRDDLSRLNIVAKPGLPKLRTRRRVS